MAVQKLIDSTFYNADGQLTKVSAILDDTDFWQTKDGLNIISHQAVKKLARIAGISKNYEVEESKIDPSYKNELEHIVRVKIRCIRVNEDGSCVHGPESYQVATGEANRNNTSWRGKDRLRMMAEKRGYDIAVLEFLGLHTSIYSEAESESFERDAEQKKQIYDTDIEAVASEINMINTCGDVAELEKVAEQLKAQRLQGKYTEAQLDFLYGIYGRKLAELQKAL